MRLPTFHEFFRELNRTDDGHPFEPFPWQNELAEFAVAGEWPDFIAAPTGSGKTACLEVAVYALAAQAHLPPAERRAPRRIFFIVNRRVIVDEAFERAQRITFALAKLGPDQPACAAVAKALRSLNSSPFPHRPLDCVQLRGAIFRDQRWTRSLLQPTLVATTIDQIGSRMLFRGYGVTPNARPIHAALVATDALWILDEAHISRPFAETVATLQRYRENHLKNTPTAITPPTLRWVQMTATPPKGTGNVLQLSASDHSHPVLKKRLNATKPARLTISDAKSKAKEQEALANDLIEQAAAIIVERAPRSLAIMVNRVATARLVAQLIVKETHSKNARFKANTSLLIGRMRPLDRDSETRRIRTALKTTARREPIPEGEAPPPVEIVVATQCLEVGADLDFDALVTECASLDALRQRFGRLNRTGRDIPAEGAIVMPGHLIETDRERLDKLAADNQPLDPIYGNGLSETWNWLQSVEFGDTVDFGLTRMGDLVKNLPEEELNRLQAPTSSAPTLFPAYLDAWAQTNPTPWPDPEPSLFLHGKQRNQPDVLIVWRADLTQETDLSEADALAAAIQNLSLCPPSQVEALPVPLHVFQNWFFQASAKTVGLVDTGDVLDAATCLETPAGRDNKKEPIGSALIWRGTAESATIKEPGDVYPGVTIVLPLTLGGWSQLGQIPNAPTDPSAVNGKEEPPTLADLLPIDRAEEAFRITRDRALLRLRGDLFSGVNGSEAWKNLLRYADNTEESLRQSEVKALLVEASQNEALPEFLRQSLSWMAASNFGFNEARYADERGIVLTTKGRLRQNDIIPQGEDEGDELSRSTTSGPVTLRDHTNHVRELVYVTAQALGLNKELCECLACAADLHDWGKLDPRFQALLLGGNPHAAYALAEPLAKSDRFPTSAREQQSARKRSALPQGFRHEFASLQLTEYANAVKHLPSSSKWHDLLRHLIASHHGYARPFAPVVDDPNPPALTTDRLSHQSAITIPSSERLEKPSHRLDSGVPDRFWKLLRQHGPWGLAFLETILRLADQQASEAEAEGWYADDSIKLETTAAS